MKQANPWLIALFAMQLITGCAAAPGSEQPSAAPHQEEVSNKPQEPDVLTFTDTAGKEITLTLPVERAVVINRNTAEAITLLGAKDAILATGDTTIKNNPYLDLAGKPDVGETKQVNLELILSLKPQVVFAYTNRPDQTLEEKLEPAGIKVVRINNYLPEQMDEELRLLGKLFNKTEKAEEFLQWKHSIEQLLADRVAGLKEEEKKSVLALSAGFLNTNGGYRIFPSQSIGGSPGVGEGYATIMVDEEYVLKRNPDVITLHGTWLGGYETEEIKPFEEALDNIMKSTSVSRLKAGQSRDIYFFYTNFVGSDKRYIGTLQLAKYLYPALFQDVDPQQYAQEYYEKWLGVPYKGIWTYSYKNAK